MNLLLASKVNHIQVIRLVLTFVQSLFERIGLPEGELLITSSVLLFVLNISEEKKTFLKDGPTPH